MEENFAKGIQKAIARAWKDPAFKQKLLNKPNEALKDVGVNFPKNLQLRVKEEKPNAFSFSVMFPAPSGNMKEMSDADLERLAAGGSKTDYTYGCYGC